VNRRQAREGPLEEKVLWRRGCPGLQRVQEAYVDQLLYSLVCGKEKQIVEILVKMGGVYCACFVVFHLLFWRIFKWGEDLQSVTFVNRAIMQVVNLSLTFSFVIFGYVSLFHTMELLESPLGHSLLVLIALFWLLRAVEQVVFFQLKHWGSAVFLVVFLSGALLYGIPAANAT